MSSNRWIVPLASLGGRVASRSVKVPDDCPEDLINRSEAIYIASGCRNIFVTNITTGMRKAAGYQGKPCKLRDLSYDRQFKAIMATFYCSLSRYFCHKLSVTLQKPRGLHHVQQWFNTVDGILIPFLLTTQKYNDYAVIDRLIRFGMESCASAYSTFQKELKEFRKGIKKSFATGEQYHPRKSFYFLYGLYKRYFPVNDGLKAQYRYVLMWSQTRGTGLANGEMERASLKKFEATITSPVNPVQLDGEALFEACRGAMYSSGKFAKLSIGPTAVLESTREKGGGTAFVEGLCRQSIDYEYDFRTLERSDVPPHRVSTPKDILCVCIEQARTDRDSVLKVRAHTVLEPGKARVITVASGYYQLLQGVMAHIFMPCIKTRQTKSGLTANRHMWNFLADTLHPSHTLWGKLDQYPVALSTDLSEATDYGNPSVARQIYTKLLDLAGANPDFPLGLGRLCCDLFCSDREVRIGDHSVTKTRGWFMGDYMTKVILTTAQLYALKRNHVEVASIVGDDLILLHNDRKVLENHLKILRDLDFKVSEDDTFISNSVMFYTEEGALVPRDTPDLLYRKLKQGKQIPYVDYPRTRLLLPVLVSTDRYSQTNNGRFALLGKECLYVHRTAPESEKLFQLASLIQHLMLPSDPDTMCPFTPIEIGGDGAYSPDPDFVLRVIENRSRSNASEVIWRMRKSVRGSYMPKFFRSPHLNKTVEKHDLVVLISDDVRDRVPQEALVVPETTRMKVLLRSFKGTILKDPVWYWAKLRQAEYYQSILDGHKVEPPPLPILNREYHGQSTVFDPKEIVTEFNYKLGKEGIKTFTDYPYYIRSDLVHNEDYLSLHWDWNPPVDSEFKEYLKQALDIKDRLEERIFSIENLDDDPELQEMAHLVVNPDIVVEYQFLHKIKQLLEDPPTKSLEIQFITGDLKLVRPLMWSVPAELVQGGLITISVYDPIIYNAGQLDNVKDRFHVDRCDTEHQICDGGAMAFAETALDELYVALDAAALDYTKEMEVIDSIPVYYRQESFYKLKLNVFTSDVSKTPWLVQYKSEHPELF